MADPEVVRGLARLHDDLNDLKSAALEMGRRIDALGNRVTALESTAATLKWIIPILIGMAVPLLINALQ